MTARAISFRRLLTRLTALAALSASPAVAAPAPATAACDQDCEDELDADRVLELHDATPDAAADLGRGLALALGRMRPLGATHLVATWALAPDPVRRLAVATALEWTFPVVGDGLAIDHLSRDVDPKIRMAAARAAWARRTTLHDVAVLARLVEDPDPDVRAIARAAVL